MKTGTRVMLITRPPEWQGRTCGTVKAVKPPPRLGWPKCLVEFDNGRSGWWPAYSLMERDPDLFPEG